MVLAEFFTHPFAGKFSVQACQWCLLIHVSCVRGSPLLRTILVFGVLCISALGFVKLTGGGDKSVEPVVGSEGGGNDEVAAEKMIPAKVRLTLSCMSGMVDVSAGVNRMEVEAVNSHVFAGDLEIDPENPVIFVKVACIVPESEGKVRNFAKLVVEAEGQETFTHVFDADGDIDDFVELPF